ncbi:hypothetical protein GBA52_020276 [Prunus armeniaca]|nr:hypothetical protein GBA52_020276 [Prunus armeniaca]
MGYHNPHKWPDTMVVPVAWVMVWVARLFSAFNTDLLFLTLRDKFALEVDDCNNEKSGEFQMTLSHRMWLLISCTSDNSDNMIR